MTDFVLRLEPYFYVHIHDSNVNNTTLVTGPATITVAQHQQVVLSAQPFIVVPPQHYCIVENPVELGRDGQPVADRRGQVRVRIGEREVRLHRAPFPLYPGETVVEQKPLIVLSPLNALMLRANAACTDNNNVARVAGDEWLLRGPAVYVPNVAIDVCELRDAINVQQGAALRLRARNAFVDATGVQRTAFEEYLWTRPGAYIVGVEEVLVQVVNPIVLTPELGLHVECTESFVDTRPWAAGVERRPGQKYLVTNVETTEFLELTTERIEARVNLLKLTRRQWVVVLDPVVDGVQQLGRRKVVSNAAFFLQPGERLESAVRDVYVLSADEALLLCALEDFEDTDATPSIRRTAGELWLLQGPRDYIPHCSVRVERGRDGAEKRKRIVLADGEGVYVRNTQSGDVRAVIGGSYMLSATEELWEKELPAIVEEKLQRQASAALSYMETSTGKLPARDKTRVVRFLIPHNAISQVYDYKKRTQRTIAGPDAVLLGPDEQFTVLSLSGSEWDPKRPNLCLPKQPGAIKSLFLYLGPSSMSDVVIVETSDHARLQLQMSFDWYFDANPTNLAEVNQCFSVPDFVGDACSCIASRVRASVASVPFDTFHRHSAKVVRCAVFGVDPATNEPKSQLVIKSNRLVITSVDIQALDVLDEKTKIALQQSVKMAIEITTQSQEATARQEASVREQRARGLLERQQIEDVSANEVERKKLIEATTQSDSISSTGRAKAEAKARSEAAELEGDVAVKVARIRAETGHVKDGMSVTGESKKRDQELEHKSSIDMAEVDYSKQLSNVEAQKFQRVMSAVGQDTVVALARAGPEAQARLLKSLGLEGYLITDGTNPINLFNTAKGLTSAMPPAN